MTSSTSVIESKKTNVTSAGVMDLLASLGDCVPELALPDLKAKLEKFRLFKLEMTYREMRGSRSGLDRGYWEDKYAVVEQSMRFNIVEYYLRFAEIAYNAIKDTTSKQRTDKESALDIIEIALRDPIFKTSDNESIAPTREQLSKLWDMTDLCETGLTAKKLLQFLSWIGEGATFLKGKELQPGGVIDFVHQYCLADETLKNEIKKSTFKSRKECVDIAINNHEKKAQQGEAFPGAIALRSLHVSVNQDGVKQISRLNLIMTCCPSKRAPNINIILLGLNKKGEGCLIDTSKHFVMNPDQICLQLKNEGAIIEDKQVENIKKQMQILSPLVHVKFSSRFEITDDKRFSYREFNYLKVSRSHKEDKFSKIEKNVLEDVYQICAPFNLEVISEQDADHIFNPQSAAKEEDKAVKERLRKIFPLSETKEQKQESKALVGSSALFQARGSASGLSTEFKNYLNSDGVQQDVAFLLAGLDPSSGEFEKFKKALDALEHFHGLVTELKSVAKIVPTIPKV